MARLLTNREHLICLVDDLVEACEIRRAQSAGAADMGEYGRACDRAADTLAGLFKSEPKPAAAKAKAKSRR